MGAPRVVQDGISYRLHSTKRLQSDGVERVLDPVLHRVPESIVVRSVASEEDNKCREIRNL